MFIFTEKITLLKLLIAKKMDVMTAFLNDDPKTISEVLDKQKYSKVTVVLDFLCPKYEKTLIEVTTISLKNLLDNDCNEGILLFVCIYSLIRSNDFVKFFF